jgi:hypothetical protein
MKHHTFPNYKSDRNVCWPAVSCSDCLYSWKITRPFRQLHAEELHNLYSSQNICASCWYQRDGRGMSNASARWKMHLSLLGDLNGWDLEGLYVDGNIKTDPKGIGWEDVTGINLLGIELDVSQDEVRYVYVLWELKLSLQTNALLYSQAISGAKVEVSQQCSANMVCISRVRTEGNYENLLEFNLDLLPLL